VPQNSRDIRTAIEAKWREYLSKYGNLFSSDSLSGTSPPSVFVGSYNYPKVLVGPMAPPVHGDTALLDAPEKWVGKGLEEIVNYRLNLVRGTQKIPADNPAGRYIESLQEVAMASRPIDSEIRFTKATAPVTSIDGESAPFGAGRAVAQKLDLLELPTAVFPQPQSLTDVLVPHRYSSPPG